MKRRIVWTIAIIITLVLVAGASYWAYTARQERGQTIYLPLSLQARGKRVANYYVDSSVPGPGTGTIGDPWDDIASNIGGLIAGDTMYLRGGVVAQVYNELEINVTPNGTAVNPVTVEPYGTELVEIRAPAAGDYIFDITGDWTVINGKGQLTLNKNHVSGGAVYVQEGADDCSILNTTIHGARHVGAMVRVRGHRLTIDGCTIYDTFNSDTTDSAGISFQRGTDLIVQNSTIYDCAGDGIIVDDADPSGPFYFWDNEFYTTLGRCSENGIDAKINSGGTQSEILRNVFHGFRACTGTCGGSGDDQGEALGLRNSCDNVLIEGNEVYDCSTGILVDDGISDIVIRYNVIHDLVDSSVDVNATNMTALLIRAKNIDVYHNTIENCPEDNITFIVPLSNVVIENNIFSNCGDIVGAALPGWSADYNCWHSCTTVLPGPHDVTGDPLFVDAAANDYHLQDTSPCIDVGRNLGLSFIGSAPDMGAFEWEAEADEAPLIPVSPAPPAAVSGGGMATYQIWLRDWDGQRIAVFAGTGRETGGLQHSFSFQKMLRVPGQYILRLNGGDERIDSFILDYRVEFMRRDQFGGLDWYKVFEAFHRSDGWQQVETGQDIYTSEGQHYNVLLLAEPIFYPAGTAYTTKSGPAETVAKEYVNENVGSGATSPPRDYAGVMPGLTIEADGATGAAWSGGRAKKNLLDVLVELAEHAPADFMVEGTGAAAFEFRWRSGQWGDDKTQGNAAGIPAMVFDGQLGNARNTEYKCDRKAEINVCHVLGQGSGEERRVVTRASGAGEDSPWSQRSVCRDARNTYSTASLEDKGDEVLDKMRARATVRLDVAQTAATRWGCDWDIGDLVTVRYRNIAVTQKIIGVRVDVDQDGAEKIQAIMEDP